LKADPIEEIRKLGGTDVAPCVPVSPKTFEQALGSLRRGGTAVFVGLALTSMCSYRYLRSWETISKSLDRLSAIEPIRLRHLSFTRRVKTKVITEVRELRQMNEASEEVETGKAKARLVFDFQ
jgi:propanol-preferring alcohol dehydrogenase